MSPANHLKTMAMAATIQTVPSKVLPFYTCIYCYHLWWRPQSVGPNISLIFHKLFSLSQWKDKVHPTKWRDFGLDLWGQHGLRRSRVPTKLPWQQWASHLKWFCKVLAYLSWWCSKVWQPSIMFYRILFAHPETTYWALGGTCDHGHLQWMRLPLLQEFFRAQS